MTPGYTIVRKCSVCLKSIKQHTIGSGNTFGATFWTDGKREAPMLPDQPRLVMCPHCHESLWIDELEVLGDKTRNGILRTLSHFVCCILGKTEPCGDKQGKFKDAREYEEPSLDNYLEIVANGVGDPQKERYARIRAWWAGNNQRRTNAREIPMSPREAENVTVLAHTLDESDPNDLVMKAEIMRELGRFDDALSLLAKSVDENIAQAVEIIKGLSEKRDPYVQEIHFK